MEVFYINFLYSGDNINVKQVKQKVSDLQMKTYMDKKLVSR